MLSVLSFGGGVNSTALLCGLLERHERPDAILFADTGGEKPETYQHVKDMESWLFSRGFAQTKGLCITTVKYDTGPNESLEAESLANKTLPSLAFGFKGCSVKWKRQPMDRWIKKWWCAQAAWDNHIPVYRLIGIDAGEAHRGKIPDDKRFRYKFPLIEWDWGREECIEAIERAGAPMPAKSACWYCPASRKAEVLKLAAEHPELHERAVAMERNAQENLGTVKGLGRHWSWENLVKADRAQLRLFSEAPEEACMCYDGD
ncbi:hypothetical protein DRQ53_10135 [bacterium]|nr:MAG: hypothetical protein DRQ53_10135 [bacterium]